MNYTKESTWFRSLKLICVSILFWILSIPAFSQELWNVEVAFDNTISIQNYWSDDIEEVRLLVAAEYSKSVYALNIETHKDNWSSFHFPDDFNLVYGDSISLNTSQKLTISIKKKRETIHTQSFLFEPSLNLLLQLDNYQEKNIPNIWGEPIDAYTWDDKNGRNVVARSFLINSYQVENDSVEDVYLYFYHYLITEENKWELIRKFTDSYKSCSKGNIPTFNIESIELTDINRDTIGEISTFYTLRCNDNDSIPYSIKSLMSTNGEKYMIDANVDPCSNEPVILNSSLNLKDRKYFNRFLRKKLLVHL